MSTACKEMVAEFHRLNGSVIGGKKNGPEVAVLRARLMVEETAETLTALHENNIIEVADGLADLLYVIYGTAVSYGAPCEDVFIATKRQPITSLGRAAVLSFTTTVLLRLWCACQVLEKPQAISDIGQSLCTLANEVCQFAAAWGMPMKDLFAEVHRSNMTKTFANAKNTAGGKYPAGVKVKGPDYRAPDIKGILDRAQKACLTGVK